MRVAVQRVGRPSPSTIGLFPCDVAVVIVFDDLRDATKIIGELHRLQIFLSCFRIDAEPTIRAWPPRDYRRLPLSAISIVLHDRCAGDSTSTVSQQANKRIAGIKPLANYNLGTVIAAAGGA